MGEYLRSELRALALDQPALGAVRGQGLIAGVDVVSPDDSVAPRSLTRRVVEALRDRQVLVGATGRSGAVLKVRPPLIWEVEQVDELVRELRGVLTELVGG